MQPTVGKVFVRKAEQKNVLAKSEFEVINSSEAKYEVTKVGENVSRCRVGDFILFTDYKSYQFEGEYIYIVDQDDINAVKVNSELKK